MNEYGKNALWAGIFFLVAMVASLTGGTLVGSVTDTTIVGGTIADTGTSNLLTSVSENTPVLVAGVILDMVNALCVLGIAAMLVPLLSKASGSLAQAYLALRILEAATCFVAAAAPLLLLPLAEVANPAGAEVREAIGQFLVAVRSLASGIILPIFFCLGALILYTQLYRLRAVPRFISIWGFLAVIGVALVNFIPDTGNFIIVLALPIILNEIFLGIWLVAKGAEAAIPAAKV